MPFKLLKSLAVCVANKSQNHFLPKSRFSFTLQKKIRFYCSKNLNNGSPESSNSLDSPESSNSLDSPESTNSLDSPESSNSLKIKQLLNSSSPLRISAELDLDNENWATSPYPEGTVFRDTEEKSSGNEEFKEDVTRSVIMFPGQGNQFVGMAKNLVKYPVALDMFNAANEILNYDLLKICLEGPENKLNDTLYCQPATFVCSLALLEKLKEEKPWVISNCWATCGYSLGELTALVFAGCVNFETGLKLVKYRAKAMALCCEKTSGGMLTIFTGPQTTLGKAFSDAIEYCKSKGIEKPQCGVASFLFPNCKVIAGNIQALEFIEDNAKNYKIHRHSRLPVSGAFHTSLMEDAKTTFSKKLKYIQLNKPVIKVYSNVTGKPYKSEKQILKYLPKQICLSVKWEQTVHNLFAHYNSKPHTFIFECGPGKSLTTTVKKINFQAARNCYTVPL